MKVKAKETGGLKPAMRYDSRPIPPGYTPPGAVVRDEDQKNGADEARMRMLTRMGIIKEQDSSAAARERMIQRHRDKKK